MGGERIKMVNYGFIFPGQGAQSVGMGKDYYDNSPAAKAIFDKADEVLGFSLSKLCFEGPEEDLRQTINAQVAIFTVSMAILAALKEKNPDINPVVNCGLSLGEYSALVSAGCMEFEDALKLVRKRGELMECAANDNPGSMVSVIGLDDEICVEVAKAADVDVANFNCPGQIVLSGLKENVQKAHDLAVEKGARKAVMLNVSGAFHSRLMQPAADGMKEVLADVALNVPEGKFIPNVTAENESDVDAIKDGLVKQVSGSVKWTQTMQLLHKEGIVDYLEVGPGKVLKGLARRVDRSLNVISLEKYEALASI